MFYSGLIIFFGIHLVPLFRKLRVFLKEKLGEGPYMGLFSAVTLAGILLIIFGTIFGEFAYFWAMEKKTLKRLGIFSKK